MNLSIKKSDSCAFNLYRKLWKRKSFTCNFLSSKWDSSSKSRLYILGFLLFRAMNLNGNTRLYKLSVVFEVIFTGFWFSSSADGFDEHSCPPVLSSSWHDLVFTLPLTFEIRDSISHSHLVCHRTSFDRPSISV